MASSNDSTLLYAEPSLARPTVQQLKSIAEKLHIHMETSELEQYQGAISAVLRSHDHVDRQPEPSLPFKYPTTAGYQPTSGQNPYNAWARIIDLAGADIGKLAGKTVAVKDNVHIAGVPMSNGSNFLRGLVSSQTATVISRILDEGGFVKGKSTCESLCLSASSFTSSSGPVLNPYDKRYSSGGSSSGSGVLVAIGEVDVAVGADQGGSIRVPSSWCGIVGLKPTYGLVPYTGILSLDCPIDHCGPMARTVYDCALLLEVMAGSDGLDPRQPTSLSSTNYTSQLTEDVTGLRVGLLKEGFEDCEADVDDVVRRAAESLVQIGVHVEEFSSSLHRLARDVALVIGYQGVYNTYTFGGLTPLNMKGFKDTATHDFTFNASKSAADCLSTAFKWYIVGAAYVQENYGHHFYAKALNVLRDIVAGYDELFKKYDVIIVPTVKFKALPLPEANLTVEEYVRQSCGNMDNTAPYNATGHPALTINAGFSSTKPHLPIGMMLIGRHFDDVTVLRLAHAYETRLRNQSTEYMKTATRLQSSFYVVKS